MMDNLQLCNAVEEWVRDYYSTYLMEIKDSLLEEVTHDIYRGDFVDKDDIKVGGSITITNGLMSWTTSTSVAIGFAEKHAENLQETLDEDEIYDLEEYLDIVYVLQGSKRVINLVKLSKTLNLDRDTVELINEEEENILYLENTTTFTIKEMRQIDNIWYVYLQE